MKSGITVAAQGTTHTRSIFAVRAVVSGATVVAFVGLASVPAFAAPGATTSTDSTVATVNVSSGITMTAPADFSLTGFPGQTVTTGAIPFTVTTNSTTGYDVTVQALAETLVADAGNASTIPIAALTVDSTASGTYRPVEGPSGDPVQLHTQGAASAAGGDVDATTYRMLIPAVAADAYTVTLDYIANVGA